MDFDDKTIEKIDGLLQALGEADKLSGSDEELSVDELDKVSAGVAVPDYNSFLRYVRERDKGKN